VHKASLGDAILSKETCYVHPLVEEGKEKKEKESKLEAR
jgi:hypothetical protein